MNVRGHCIWKDFKVKRRQDLESCLRGIVSLCMGADYWLAKELVGYLIANDYATHGCYVGHPYKLKNHIRKWVKNSQLPNKDGKHAPPISEQII
jgi:hypothetical protein